MRSILFRLGRSSVAFSLAVALMSASVAAFQLLSVEDEIRLGRDAHADLRRQLAEVRDPVVREYVTALGEALVAHASGPAYPYTFTAAADRDLNAFALPGGPVWINRGILEAAETEAQVAGVLAHEIAHVAGRHSARQLTKSFWTSGVLAVVGALIDDEHDWRAAAVGLGAYAAASGVLLKFSRNDERAADAEGVRILERAGYDTRGLLEFLHLLEARQGRAPHAVARFFSTHPAPRDRVRGLERLIGDGGGGRRDSPAFVEVKQRLARMR